MFWWLSCPQVLYYLPSSYQTGSAQKLTDSLEAKHVEIIHRESVEAVPSRPYSSDLAKAAGTRRHLHALRIHPTVY